MLYQHELGDSPLTEIFSSFDRRGYPPFIPDRESSDPAQPNPVRFAPPRGTFRHARRLVEGTLEQQTAIDKLIRRHAENWRLERMPPIDRNILRLAIFEMLNEIKVPRVVVVNEAIELAKKFGSESSGRFVNGLLDAVLRSQASAPEAV